jgi:prepilin-type N-terminal cleavage/methylation domain-containing protein
MFKRNVTAPGNARRLREVDPMMKKRCPPGFTLLEILIVVVLLAILASVVIPQWAGTTERAAETTAKYNVNELRSRVQVYKSEHNGEYPATLDLLTVKTNRSGTSSAGDGPLLYGPYVVNIPDNPLVDIAFAAIVAAPGANPPTSPAANAGWLYDSTTGEVWINHADYLDW